VHWPPRPQLIPLGRQRQEDHADRNRRRPQRSRHVHEIPQQRYCFELIAIITMFFLIFHHDRPHVAGKKILTALNCKEAILSYLMSDNDAIKREAIACVSEMLTATI
jgi:hypothetical protein